MQCRVTNKPYDVFGAWYDNDHLLSGTLYWTGDFNSVSAVWLSKASQEVESEIESVSMVLYRFENVNSSSIRLLHVAEIDKEEQTSDYVMDRDSNYSANSSIQSSSLGQEFPSKQAKNKVKKNQSESQRNCLLDKLLKSEPAALSFTSFQDERSQGIKTSESGASFSTCHNLMFGHRKSVPEANSSYVDEVNRIQGLVRGQLSLHHNHKDGVGQNICSMLARAGSCDMWDSENGAKYGGIIFLLLCLRLESTQEPPALTGINLLDGKKSSINLDPISLPTTDQRAKPMCTKSIATQTEGIPSRTSSFHSLSHTSRSSSLSPDLSNSAPREKLLIYTWGSETYIPHKIGIKRMRWSDFSKVGSKK
ncbi:hypothetical protein Btru_069747 [Bulinus truncatus]|nr:hypothetical protein Btru_069747 [Bulinus truncatus]